MCSKEIGAKMKRKEPVGENDTLPPEVVGKLDSLTAEDVRVSIVFDICTYAVIEGSDATYMYIFTLVFILWNIQFTCIYTCRCLLLHIECNEDTCTYTCI